MAASSDHFTGTNGERMWFSRRQIAPEMTRRLLGLINERGARFIFGLERRAPSKPAAGDA